MPPRSDNPRSLRRADPGRALERTPVNGDDISAPPPTSTTAGRDGRPGNDVRCRASPRRPPRRRQPRRRASRRRNARRAKPREREAKETEARLAAATLAVAATGTVRIAISPWGLVEVDGASSGAAPPITELTLAEGRHQIVVRNGDYRAVHATVKSCAGQTVDPATSSAPR